MEIVCFFGEFLLVLDKHFLECAFAYGGDVVFNYVAFFEGTEHCEATSSACDADYASAIVCARESK